MDNVMENKIVEPRAYTSGNIEKLTEALAKAQGEMETAGKSGYNSFRKVSYSTYEDIVRASRPALSKNGLAILQCLTEDNVLITILSHSSGQFISSRTPVIVDPVKAKENYYQAFKGAVTYLKRICYESITGVISYDEEEVVEEPQNKPTNATKVFPGKVTPVPMINDILEAFSLLYDLDRTKHEKLTSNIYEKYKIANLKELPLDAQQPVYDVVAKLLKELDKK